MKNPNQLMLPAFSERAPALREKRTLQDYINVGHERGIEWIGDKLPQSANERTLFICSQGHRFISTYGHVKSGGGCAKCAHKAPLTTDDYHALAHKSGFEWRGIEIPRHNKINTEWFCLRCGKSWMANYLNIQRGSGCPHCLGIVNGHFTSKVQNRLHALLGGALNFRIGKYSADILITCGDKRVAIEYDGWYWHQLRKSNEEVKNAYLLSKGLFVLHIKGRNNLPTLEQVNSAIDKLTASNPIGVITLDDWKS